MVNLGVTIRKNNAGKLASLFDQIVSRATEKEAQQMATDVRHNIEKYGLIDTGRMLGSVKASGSGGGWSVSVEAKSDEGFGYPALHNFGGRYVPAKPFFTEAVVKAEEDYPKSMKSAIEGALS